MRTEAAQSTFRATVNKIRTVPRALDIRYRPAAGNDALTLTFGGVSIPLHPYAFAVDTPADNEPAAVRSSFSKLLTAWKRAIASTKAGQTLYLPYDFEDQATHWLRVKFTDNDCALQLGWSPLEGARIKPSQWNPEIQPHDDFERREYSRTLRTTRMSLMNDIDAACDAL